MEDNRLLVGGLGTNPYEETKYRLPGGGDYSTRFTQDAIANLSGVEVDTALIARTQEAADKHEENLRKSLEDAGVDYRSALIPRVTGNDDIDEVFNTLLGEIREINPSSIILDITHGFRSLPMVFFPSLMYMETLNQVELDGIYYGEYNKTGESEIIDLTYLYTLMEWYHALKSFEKTGSMGSVSEMISDKKERLYREGENPQDLEKMSRKLRGVSHALDSGLPLEAGTSAREAVEVLDNIDEAGFVGPEGAIIDPLREDLSEFEVEQEVSDKSEMDLDMDELERQTQLIDFYRENGKYWLGLQCARETFLSRVMYEEGGMYRSNWLDTDKRQRISRKRLYRDDFDSEDEDSDTEYGYGEPADKEIISLWDTIREQRNNFAHSGFKINSSNTDKANQVLDEFTDKMRDEDFWEGV